MSDAFEDAVREALRQTYRDSILVGGELSTDYADKHAPRVAAELRAALLADETALAARIAKVAAFCDVVCAAPDQPFGPRYVMACADIGKAIRTALTDEFVAVKGSHTRYAFSPAVEVLRKHVVTAYERGYEDATGKKPPVAWASLPATEYLLSIASELFALVKVDAKNDEPATAKEPT